MRALGYVAFTFSVIGLLLSLTIYGLVISWIFLVPAVILARKECKRIFAETGRTAGALVVIQVLSWISIGLSGLLILGTGGYLAYFYANLPKPGNTSIASPVAPPTTDRFFSEYNRRYLAKGYGATVEVLSLADAERVRSFQPYLTAWNDNTAKIFRDYRDQTVTAAQFASNSQKYIVELRGALMAIGYCNSLADDPGMKATVNQLLEIRTKTLAGLVDLQTAYASQDTALAKKALIQIEEDRKADRSFSEQMIVRIRAAGFDPGKDLDSQPNLDRTLGILKSPSGS